MTLDFSISTIYGMRTFEVQTCSTNLVHLRASPRTTETHRELFFINIQNMLADWAYQPNKFCYFRVFFVVCTKDQIISKGLLVSSNSPKEQTNQFVFTTMVFFFFVFFGEFEDPKKSFQNYLTSVLWYI